MKSGTPVEKISAILAEVGYQRVSMPMEIGGVSFDIPAALVGNTPSPDLVLVADSVMEDEKRVLRKIEGVARALDVVGSRRPLTTVIAGPRPSASILEAMGKVSRVLPIGTVSADKLDEALRNWLAVLLPLKLPETVARTVAPLEELLGSVSQLPSEIVELVSLAKDGKEVISERINQIIIDAIVTEETDGDE